MSSLRRKTKETKKGTVFIDFDGTIVDNIIRQYYVYKQVAGELKLKNRLMKTSYWRSRRAGMSFAGLFKAKHAVADISSVQRKYKQLIEERILLDKDRKIKGVVKILTGLAKNYALVLVSLRSKRNNFLRQIEQLGLKELFAEIKVASATTDPVKAKRRLIENSKFYKTKNRYLIGDTEVDIQAGKKAKCLVVAVCSGIRCADYLSAFCPEYLIADISKAGLIIR